MDWNPKDWTWAPRLDRGVAWACRTLPAALAFALKARLNIDRWNFRGLWTRLGWLPRNYVKILWVAFLVLLPFWGWMIVEVSGEIRTLTGDAIPRKTSDDLRNIAYALGVTITALAGLLAAPLILIRTWVSERNATTAEQGLITDRITKAVEQLGAEKTIRRREFKPLCKKGDDDNWLRDENGNPVPATRPDGAPLGDWESVEETLPNLEVRLGAIYALERIAQDSERDHIPIMETLCAYIRENAPAGGAVDDGGDDWPDDADDTTNARLRADLKARIENLREWVCTLPAPRVDIQAALSVIGRRGAERIAHERRQRRSEDSSGFRLDLRNTNLQRADLTGARLDHARLIGARMQGANLWGARAQWADLTEARMQGAILVDARMQGAVLLEARMQGAELWEARMQMVLLLEARMQGANLREARMQGAYLSKARMQGAVLSEARMQGANLMWARMQGAGLSEARMQGAEFSGAGLDGAILRGANLRSESLTQDQINAAFGDSAAILPDGIVMPDHWDDETIGPDDPDPKYNAWLAAGAPPGEPRQAPPKPANTPSPPPPD
jgi:uncharacterized protein YjbI with pentapeptide repeats